MRGKKLRDNGRWDSSRFMIPEHVAGLRIIYAEQMKHERPEVDEDQMELIAQAVQRSYQLKEEITLVVYDVLMDKVVTGVVEYADPFLQRIRIGDEYVWFRDILRVL